MPILTKRSPIPLPTGLPRKFLSELLVFGVACALSAAPFLGAKRIPWFEPLISIFPEEQRSLLIPVSSLLIGLVALAIQFYAGEAISRRSIRKGFPLILLIVLISIVSLLTLYVSYVVRLQVNVDEEVVVQRFVIGWYRLPTCKCGSDLDCIIGASQAIEKCWSERSITQVKLALFLSYLIAIEGFAVLVGLLVLRGEKIRQQKIQKRSARQPKKGTTKKSGSSKSVSSAAKQKS